MITQLTPEQIDTFPRYVTEWTAHGLSTEPADRPRAEAAIPLIRRIIGNRGPVPKGAA
jgi:hypothetical protein